MLLTSGVTIFQSGTLFTVINSAGNTGISLTDNAGVDGGLGIAASHPDVVRGLPSPGNTINDCAFVGGLSCWRCAGVSLLHDGDRAVPPGALDDRVIGPRAGSGSMQGLCGIRASQPTHHFFRKEGLHVTPVERMKIGRFAARVLKDRPSDGIATHLAKTVKPLCELGNHWYRSLSTLPFSAHRCLRAHTDRRT